LPFRTSIEWLNIYNGDNVATLQPKKFTVMQLNYRHSSAQLISGHQTGQVDGKTEVFTLTENEQSFNAR
jgi:hypothetical protein